MADLAASSTSNRKRSTGEMIVDRVWRFFTSVRNAIYEIAFLTLLVLIGTLRGSSVPRWIADAVPPLEGLVERWYAWDVFRSGIFAATLALIAVAIIICTLNRVPGIWATINHPKITTSHGFLKSAETSATYTLNAPVPEVLDQVTGVMAGSRFRVIAADTGEQTHIYADKNRWSNLGTFPFHLGLILILVGGIVASTYGFRDNEFVVVEGSRRNVGHGTGLAIELNRFRDSWTAQGVPADYTSEVTIYHNGEPVHSGDVRVNHPMNYGNATIYQSSFGTSAEFTIRDRAGNIVFADSTELGLFTMRDNPDAPAGLLNLPIQGIVFEVVAPDSNPMNEPELDTLQLQSGQMWVSIQGQPESAVVVTQGVPQNVGDYTVTFEREGRYSVLQVGYNPGIPIFIIASIALLGGLMVTFYLPHRRVRGILETVNGQTQLTLAPLAKRDWSGKRAFFQIIEKLNDAVGDKPEVRAPRNASDFAYLQKNPIDRESNTVD